MISIPNLVNAISKQTISHSFPQPQTHLEEQDPERTTPVLSLNLVFISQYLDRNCSGRECEPRTNNHCGGKVHPKQIVGNAASESDGRKDL